ncbi:ShlB/FhaC/HecB family hemolysin secretion/activation protein [Marinobacter caseinilyticus]|uniref:ShlB/FhaC/HecB family hemolysin secretion/activation protein n=1 Tax=Marinobacter caseinilyticus TaxID=2692195 RepID=UPI00140B9AEE|nr:ShlB/FhaC/HecB family hemolysin secretion/activation protein [Marinobacter caseinilyticus]
MSVQVLARANATGELDLSIHNLAPDPGTNAPAPDKDAEASPPDPSLHIHAPNPSWLGERLSFRGDSQQANGDYRGRLDLAANDLTGLNDALQLNYNRSLAGRADAHARGFNFDYSFPSRFGVIAINGDLSEYEDSVIGSGYKFQVSGERHAIDMSARRNLFGNRMMNLDALLGAATEESSRFEEGAEQRDSSRQFSAVWIEGRMNYDLGLLNTAAFTSVSVENGFEHYRETASAANDTAEYRKYTVLGSLSKPLWRWTWDLNGQYQYSPDALPGSEKLLVAGSSLISGFAGQGASSSRGGWLRLDASSPWLPLMMLSNMHSSLRLSVLKGWIAHTTHQVDHHGSASAAEVALQVKSAGMTAGLRVGKMLGESLRVMSKPDVPDVSLTLSLSLE